MIEPLDAPFELTSDDALDEAALHARHPAFADFAAKLGNTSLISVPGPEGGAAVLAKCEYENPAGSVKDRVAYAMLARAVHEHGDRPLAELKVLEYSGGTLARSLARLCAELGVQARFVLSSASPRSLLDDLGASGARVHLVDKDAGFVAVIRTALDLAAAEPDWQLLYQHRNSANLRFHQRTTGAELLEQLAGRAPAAWVASIGTGGTLIGVLRALRAHHPLVRAIGVTPEELPYGSHQPPNGLPKYAGSGGFGDGLRQPFVTLHDDEVEHHAVSYPRALSAMAEFRELTALRIGSSAAANWLIAQRVAARLSPEQTVVTVFPDAGTPEEWERIS